MDKKKLHLFVLIFIAAILIAGFLFLSGPENNKANHESDIIAVYVPYDSGHIMVDETTNSVFKVSFPDEIYDIDGNKIPPDNLEAGNIIRISGDCQMSESYPGQYPGVHCLEVIDEGSPEDIEKYNEILHLIHPENIVTDVPVMNIEYITSDVIDTLIAEPVSCEWSSDDITLSQKSSQVPDVNYALPNITISDPTDLSIVFSSTPDNISITKYDLEDLTPTPVSYSQYEDENEKLFTIPKVFGNFIYEINAIWPEGQVTFGFHVYGK